MVVGLADQLLKRLVIGGQRHVQQRVQGRDIAVKLPGATCPGAPFNIRLLDVHMKRVEQHVEILAPARGPARL